MKKQYIPPRAADRMGEVQIPLVTRIAMQHDRGRVRAGTLRDIDDAIKLGALALDHDRLPALSLGGSGPVDGDGIHYNGIQGGGRRGSFAPGPGDSVIG